MLQTFSCKYFEKLNTDFVCAWNIYETSNVKILLQILLQWISSQDYEYMT